MKKIYCLLFAMLPLAAWAGEVKVTKPVLTLENDTLTLDFKFNMEAVKVNSTQSYAFTPVLFAGKNCKTLPPVVVTGKNKFKMRHKDRKLARKGDYNAPYTIIKGKSADRRNLVNYTRMPPLRRMDEPGGYVDIAGRQERLSAGFTRDSGDRTGSCGRRRTIAAERFHLRTLHEHGILPHPDRKAVESAL